MSLAISLSDQVARRAQAEQHVAPARNELIGEHRSLSEISDVAACLMPLLAAMGWRGGLRHIYEALPHSAHQFDIVDLRNVLANLRYVTRPAQVSLFDLDERLLPCIFVTQDSPTRIILRRDSDGFLVYDGAKLSEERIAADATKGTAYFVSEAEEEESAPTETWIGDIVKRFRKLFISALLISFLTNLFSLCVPLFIMTVYDKVVGSRSLDSLVYLASGAALALTVDLCLRLIRARILAYVGARIDLILGNSTFAQVLNLPQGMTDRATLGAQISKLKQFEAIREFFTGPLATVVLDLPFVVLFIAVIGVISGPMVLIPIGLIAVFLIAGLILIPLLQSGVAAATTARAKRQAFILEVLSNHRTIKECASEPTWSARFRELSARAAFTNFQTTQVSTIIQTVAQIVMLVAGISTVAVGAARVLAGDMTGGALIATVALSWRVLSPLQTGFLTSIRLEQVRLSLKQINQLMTLDREGASNNGEAYHRQFEGGVEFRRVSLRYHPAAEPALMGVSFVAKPKEIIAITGPSGSGKSTILKLTAGLYHAQAGAVLIDGIDIRQLDIGETRAAIAYVAQNRQFFHGTIAQNLRLANPTASDAELIQATIDSGVLGEILSLPDGLDTRLTDELRHQLTPAFMQRLMLTRAFVKPAAIYLLDVPETSLDAAADEALRRKLTQLRRRATIVMVTHRPSHLQLADRVIYMESGRVLHDGPPEDVIRSMQGAH